MTSRPKPREIDLPSETKLHCAPGTKGYVLGETFCMVSQDPIGGDDPRLVGVTRWHMSISANGRYPTWDEIVEARDQLLPNHLHFSMPLPPREFWLSYHPTCFHLWEMRDEALAAQFEWEGMMARGTRFGGHKPLG